MIFLTGFVLQRGKILRFLSIRLQFHLHEGDELLFISNVHELKVKPVSCLLLEKKWLIPKNVFYLTGLQKKENLGSDKVWKIPNFKLTSSELAWCHDTHHNDTQPNDIRNNGTENKVLICNKEHDKTVIMLSVIFFIVMQNVVMLSVIKLVVVVHLTCLQKRQVQCTKISASDDPFTILRHLHLRHHFHCLLRPGPNVIKLFCP
jgi:hypothetical protein